MGLFANILEKLGLKKPAAAAPAPATPTRTTKPVIPGANTVPTSSNFKVAPDAASLTPANHPSPVEVVDVVSKLEAMAKANPQKLDWKVSIVDLLKLLDLDSSLAARKELATELGCPPEKMGGDYTEMNVWLHKTVLKRIADNGGNIPADLLK